MNAAYTWYSVANLILHGSVGIVILVVVSIGWMRYRRLGYLVLIGWALVSMFSGTVMIFTGGLHSLMARLFPSADRTLLIVLPGMAAYLVSSLLLVAGLGLLVFRDAPSHARGSDAPASR
jgi:hypothetical protein